MWTRSSCGIRLIADWDVNAAGRDLLSGCVQPDSEVARMKRSGIREKAYPHYAALHAGYIKMVPRRGLEPPRVAPLVPETSASTNSATSAGGRTRAKPEVREPRTLPAAPALVNASPGD